MIGIGNIHCSGHSAGITYQALTNGTHLVTLTQIHQTHLASQLYSILHVLSHRIGLLRFSNGVLELQSDKRTYIWRASQIVLHLPKATRDDYVLVECIDKEIGGPNGLLGIICNLVASLGVIDAYVGLNPPNGGHPIWRSKSNLVPADQPRSSLDVYHQQNYDWDTFRFRYTGF